MAENNKSKPPVSENTEDFSSLPKKEDAEVGLLNLSLDELSSEIIGEYRHSAPVKMPNREELTVRLVNISLLQRLDELRGDVTLMQTILWTIIGTILGFATSLFGSEQSIDQIDKRSWWLFLLLIIFAGVFGYLTQRANKRAVKLRNKLFQDGE
ncbi:hypothetical protein [Flavilitoribacter nigricans]|uniref:Magnesium transporter n=1 Tax=Flavilitoribacter nigricans (strain ATCC 23147 / DSM 23189 / NBRC 102662 / NCIMB 1420 / SS-2) TaxID=1122177 RepID=A0A2D0MXC9_FLAN2|nr:hypothetical protein [Flavilitoribacter nigricans]PHN00914.1 hypothetical protein CRP01_39660 [Flavilitoribacter nigricans DSM 23189 = NBRC 102662]